MKEYKIEDATVLWDSTKCIHAAECVRGLPSVFKPNERPWIQLENSTKEEVVAQVHRCPSGALSMKQ